VNIGLTKVLKELVFAQINIPMTPSLLIVFHFFFFLALEFFFVAVFPMIKPMTNNTGPMKQHDVHIRFDIIATIGPGSGGPSGQSGGGYVSAERTTRIMRDNTPTMLNMIPAMRIPLPFLLDPLFNFNPCHNLKLFLIKVSGHYL
jgi:hypothetical protein